MNWVLALADAKYSPCLESLFELDLPPMTLCALRAWENAFNSWRSFSREELGGWRMRTCGRAEWGTAMGQESGVQEQDQF